MKECAKIFVTSAVLLSITTSAFACSIKDPVSLAELVIANRLKAYVGDVDKLNEIFNYNYTKALASPLGMSLKCQMIGEYTSKGISTKGMFTHDGYINQVNTLFYQTLSGVIDPPNYSADAVGGFTKDTLSDAPHLKGVYDSIYRNATGTCITLFLRYPEYQESARAAFDIAHDVQVSHWVPLEVIFNLSQESTDPDINVLSVKVDKYESDGGNSDIAGALRNLMSCRSELKGLNLPALAESALKQ